MTLAKKKEYQNWQGGSKSHTAARQGRKNTGLRASKTEGGRAAYTLSRNELLMVAWRTTMKPIPTTGGDCEDGITAPVEKDTQTTEQDQAAECEYLPMDVYIDSETRHAHFRYKPDRVNRRKSRHIIWKICS